MELPAFSNRSTMVWGKPDVKAKQKTFVCFGAVRGGTSAVAGAMRQLGVFMGDDVPHNHEDQEFIARGNPHRLKMISARNGTHDVWGWKDPNAAMYLNALVQQLRSPHYVIVFRDAVATAQGHARWHSREAKFAISDIIVSQHRNILFALYCNAPCLLVSYERLITKPLEFADELAAFLGVPAPAGEARDKLVEFLAPGAYKQV